MVGATLETVDGGEDGECIESIFIEWGVLPSSVITEYRECQGKIAIHLWGMESVIAWVFL